MQIKNPQHTIFYLIEKTIKTYRQFAQRNIKAKGYNITIDQTLLLSAIQDFPKASQTQLSQMIFKDYASITRMIELLVKSGYLTRVNDEEDRRRHKLIITKEGKSIVKKLNSVVVKNRKIAIGNISNEEITELTNTLNKIIYNLQTD